MFRRIFGRERKEESKQEIEKEKTILFQDLNDPQEAKKHSVKPGFFFLIYPVLPHELEDDLFLHSFTPKFFDRLREEGILSLGQEEGKSRIYVERGQYVDPAMAWEFSMEGCLDIGAIQEEQRSGVGMLVVRAEKIEQDKAQDSIVQKFNKDRDSLRVIMSETDSDLASRENL
jgi:hypothetical protein